MPSAAVRNCCASAAEALVLNCARPAAVRGRPPRRAAPGFRSSVVLFADFASASQSSGCCAGSHMR